MNNDKQNTKKDKMKASMTRAKRKMAKRIKMKLMNKDEKKIKKNWASQCSVIVLNS